MRSLARAFRNRVVPALLTAAGVTLLAAGLLNYGGNVQASAADTSPAPSDVASQPTPDPVLPSLPPINGRPPPRPSPQPHPNRIATPGRIAPLGVDLPIGGA